VQRCIPQVAQVLGHILAISNKDFRAPSARLLAGWFRREGMGCVAGLGGDALDYA
jgi:hypothetical protein